MLFVVVVHLLQVGIGIGANGELVASRPAEQQPWFAAATWVGQIMPLFFVVGGFAAAVGWRSWRARGGDAVGFARTRTLRLAQPALPLFVFFAIVLAAATLLQVSPDLVAAAATGAGSPLWFLAAYLLCQAAVPQLARWHARAPRATLALLATGVVLVDAARFSSGVTEVGLLNLLLVWPLIQQLGFWYHDGWFDRRHPLTLLAISAGCFLLLWPLTAWGPYEPNMLANLNPPTLPLVVLGVAQTCLLRVLRPALARLMELRAMSAAVFVLGSRLMTIYLWHLPVILVLTGLSLLVPGAALAPASAQWWQTRPLMFVVVLGTVLLLSLLLVRWERIGEVGPTPSWLVVALAWVCAFAPPFAVMQWFLDVRSALGGALLLSLSVLLLRRGSLFRRRTAPGARGPAASASVGSEA